MPQSGIVTHIAYTSGGAGNQWTAIDSVRYATWWDIRTKDWQVGDRVTFTAYEAPLWSGQPAILCAQDIHKSIMGSDPGNPDGDETVEVTTDVKAATVAITRRTQRRHNL